MVVKEKKKENQSNPVYAFLDIFVQATYPKRE
jgi:hypothetical protein